ncbi:MAG: rod shape-determining protein MreD [Bacteroidales bacterium]
MRNIIYYTLLFLLLLLAQVLVFNNIHLWGFATPILYIWLILKLPAQTPRGLLISIGFFFGLIIDLFCNTPGMHALATSLLAFMRDSILFLFVQRDEMKNGSPSFRTMGMGAFVRYIILAILLYCTALYLIEAFTLFSFPILLLKIVSSSLLTFVLMFGIESLKPATK